MFGLKYGFQVMSGGHGPLVQIKTMHGCENMNHLGKLACARSGAFSIQNIYLLFLIINHF